MRSTLAGCPAERFTVTVCSVPVETLQNTAPRAGVNGLVHPEGVSNAGLELSGTTTAATKTTPGVGGEARVSEMVTSLAPACCFWTSEIGPEVVVTVKLVELVAVPPPVETEIGPLVAPEGTVAVIWVLEFTV
jgi:hypothetical protein